MNLCIDLDGVIYNWNAAYAKALIKTSGEDKFPDGWQNDTAILAPVWDWDTYHGYTMEQQVKAWEECIFPAKCKFWQKLELMPNAKAAIIRLEGLARTGHSCYFLTHRSGDNVKLQTEKALYEAGITYPTVLLCQAEDKPYVVKALRSNVFIDDKLDTIIAAMKLELPNVFLIDAPYNRLPHACKVVANVNEALDLAGIG